MPYSDNDPRPMPARSSPTRWDFYGQARHIRPALEQYRFLLTMQDVTRARIPFPDTSAIEYPEAEWWRTISEKPHRRWGRAVDLFDRDPKTKQILEKLDEPISMSFANEDTPRRRPQVHQAGDHDPQLLRHSDLRRSDRPPGGRKVADLDRAASTSTACP